MVVHFVIFTKASYHNPRQQKYPTVIYKRMKHNSEKKENFETLDKTSIFLIILSGIFLITSFLLPYLITNVSLIPIDFSKTGPIGDTIGGIMNPFISIAGIFITFLAFYMQFRANKLQRELFNEQITNEKQQFKDELIEQRNQFSRNLFENQFYEMIKLHKENVNDIFTTQTIINDDKTKQINTIYGRKNFEFFLDEIGIAYFVAKKVFIGKKNTFCFGKAYSVVFHGIKSDELIAKNPEEENYCKFINKLNEIRKWHRTNHYKFLKKNGIKSFANDINYDYKTKNDLLYELFNGYSNFLGHYYRQLFQTVKFVVKQESLTYEEKRNYLRILRAQLTNYEQVMLFYNWLSGFGNQWENQDNKYFTDYRMIHNIYNDLLIDDFSIISIFDLMNNVDYLKEKDRLKDPIFEFEDW